VEGCGAWRDLKARLAVGTRHGAQLLHETCDVYNVPVLHDLAVANTEHVENIEGHVLARGRDAQELSLVRPREGLQRGDFVTFSDLLLDFDREVG
jgi:hypothetical protein